MLFHITITLTMTVYLSNHQYTYKTTLILGSYTDVQGTTEAACMGLCERGYYCEAGSTSARQFACGGPDRFCPRGSAAPSAVTAGEWESDVCVRVCVCGAAPIAVSAGERDDVSIYLMSILCT